jgi:lipopolysaccharide/colanic/teichoic acid biosynthesis glycosyltransferase
MASFVIERPAEKLYKSSYHTAKRIVDLLLCILSAPITVPITLAIAAIIRLTSPGPVLFVQERIGKDSRPFNIYKFRTMYHQINRESHRAFMKAFINGEAVAKDGRSAFKPFDNSQVTPIGRLLRKTSLDELPQLINIIKGEMSLVGPRPNVTWEVEEYQSWHCERLGALPGITGLAQVRGRSAIVFDEIARYDIEYIAQQSLWLDIKILWWTVASVLMGRGAH